MADDHLTAYGGLANGYVLTFTNGLKVYLSGDTGPMSDMAIIRDLYHPRLAVVNMDGVNVMGPEEAAYAMKQLVQPAAVIVSHAEEPVTTKGQVNPDTRTAQFIGLMGNTPVYVPLSGRTMEFDGNANCIACQGHTTPAGNPAPGR
jgi:L-ascorbate metabolism protein UlaG (beta-lactamase superfamily)